jgi:Mn-dependent DtxR family transcriptional regulator
MSEMVNVAEISAALKISPDTVVRRFGKLKGTVNLGSEETRGKRRYRVLRWPKHVIEKEIGQPIEIVPVVSKPKRQKNWEHHAARSLARSMKANAEDPQDRELFTAIQSHARMLTFVDEAEWDQLSTQFNFPGGEDE